ncbi:helicase C-terminal domain-domain-containing protein [Leucosporidium creatinivorum]|uniref:ATP-dependent DNA helicase CHL1 n=1 Tax=Leucosporidium creatinivorum TaxID=106004 RepID=A0A1Y2G4S4_9BASI|nr:helicase C-terminal domain-domain-containing protein [Leucosporidium creatinivorum]
MAPPVAEPSDPTFGFPFTPYSIQRDLMQHLYSALARGQVTVVESPTGTGKSLSLISSTLSYLRDARSLTRDALVESIRAQVQSQLGEEEPEWVVQHEIEKKVQELEREESELETRLGEVRRREAEERRRESAMGGMGMGRRKRLKVGEGKEGGGARLVDDEDEFAPDPYFENEEDKKKVEENGVDNFSPAVREMMKKMNGGGASNSKEEEEPDVSKIYFASRTHSQLSQFVSELRKTSFSRSNPTADPSLPSPSPPPTPSSSLDRPVRVIPLGSRQNLCINDDVRKKSGGSNEAMGDLCLELQKGGKEGKRCQFLPPIGEGAKLNEFRDKALATVHDIEDIEDLGRRTATCPYYGSRKAVRAAEIVTLPYNMLMSKSAREALGISLKDHIVVVDEAHNLIDSILQLHSVSITSSMLLSIRSALLTYINKFKNRFTGANASYLKQLALVLKGLSEFVAKWAGEGKKEELMDVNSVLGGKSGPALDQINLLKLDQYLKTSRIARKIGGYVDSLGEEQTAKGRQAIRSNATRNLQRIQDFILSLANADRDGRVLLTAETITSSAPSTSSATAKSTSTKPSHTATPPATRVEVTLKYMLLAPSESFRDVAEEARSVVLAGGTMAPMSDFRTELFPYVPEERFSTFSCGHVVPADHVATFAVSKGPTGVKLEFKFDRRKDEKLLDELGQSIVNIAQVVPKGIVVFVPSYDFLNQVQARWEASGMIKRLKQKKKTFWEPKASADVDMTLREYSAANAGVETGAILFAVVGAKLSEGINFADDMARAVIICGIPYPNSNSTELKERMAYLKSTPASVSRPSSAPDAGQVLYQNLAFRAVNQSIGRAIRNARDWAAIILLDERYQQSSKKAQLPGWLGSNVESPQAFGGLMKSLSGFVRRRKAAGGLV